MTPGTYTKTMNKNEDITSSTLPFNSFHVCVFLLSSDWTALGAAMDVDEGMVKKQWF